ncbi:hypothetical protein V2G26_012506 [Clonostachys chloroleuca]|uniref:Peptidase M43 pregnancy-associated plasma-A domain-containing protein n=1 Tax=Clonostachys chloroleuca TaxID=1926264 RepID=A0AA35LUH4_9HYPO|nr:unnamed protein product [Clonostachys chloroleuca]
MLSLKSLLLFAGAAAARVISLDGRAVDENLPCGNDVVPDELYDMTAAIAAKRSLRSRKTCGANKTSTVQVYFHVIDNGSNSTVIKDSDIDRQMRLIDEEFSKHGFHMKLANVSRTSNRDWAQDANSTGVTNMKNTLRRGRYRDLNVYIVDSIANGTQNGNCHYPTAHHPEGSREFLRDGCVIRNFVVPKTDEAATVEGKGKTLIHEVGHWFGLIHTFEGGCDKGDEVDDTPPQVASSTTCGLPAKTCPGAAAVLFKNYMDYSPGACRDSFTPGQVERMKGFWTNYRLK